MKPETVDATANLRRLIYGLLILSSAVTLVTRIHRVESSSGRTPFLSANDRSRWSTIRAIVDEGTFALDHVIFRDGGEQQKAAAVDPTLDPIRRRDSDWYSIDLVRHRGRDGREHAYSSKPPLLSVLLGGVYWCVRSVTGATLATHPFYVGRIILVIANVLPLAFAWWLLSQLVERFGKSDWGRVVVMMTVTWGTLLSPMAVTLNNHLPAAVCVTGLVYALVRVMESGGKLRRWFALAGLAAGLLAACELPALSAVALTAVGLLLVSWRGLLFGFLPPATLVAVTAIGLNIAAHGTWRPAYSQRHDGAVVAVLEKPTAELLKQLPVNIDAASETTTEQTATEQTTTEQIVIPEPLRQLLDNHPTISQPISAESVVRAAGTGRWRVWDPVHEQRWAILLKQSPDHAATSLPAPPTSLELRRWGNWYEYEGSYWSADRLQGVDRGEPSRALYAFHVLVGHHGVFSLTPIWLLSLAGMAVACRRVSREWTWNWLLVGMTLIFVVCLGFYLQRPLIDRNYGGVSCGFRWLFWFIPLWSLAALPALDWCSRSRLWQWVTVALLAASIYTAQWSALSPWAHPWFYRG